MLSFITYKDAIEQVEIVADAKGIDQLIDYLKFVKESQDHMHLNIDAEIEPYPIPPERSDKTIYAKHVRIEFEKQTDF